MVWCPKPSAEWLNGWILLVVYGIVFGVVVRSFPQDVIARLYDKSNWTRRHRLLTAVGKLFASVLFLLLAFSPLRIGQVVFSVGMGVYALGLTGVVIALFDFARAASDQPATQGLYRVSRNPQWTMLVLMFVGGCLAIGSWLAILILAGAAVFYHFRVLAEERSCLARYGDAYRDYMARVSRYFLFF